MHILTTLIIQNASRHWLLKAMWHIINKKLSKIIHFIKTLRETSQIQGHSYGGKFENKNVSEFLTRVTLEIEPLHLQPS